MEPMSWLTGQRPLLTSLTTSYIPRAQMWKETNDPCDLSSDLDFLSSAGITGHSTTPTTSTSNIHTFVLMFCYDCLLYDGIV